MIGTRLMKLTKYVLNELRSDMRPEGMKTCPHCSHVLGLLKRRESGVEIQYHYCSNCRAYIPIQHAS